MAKPGNAEKPREKPVQRKRGADTPNATAEDYAKRGGMFEKGQMTGLDALKLRESLDLTQREMGDLCGIDPKTIGRLERKRTGYLTLEMQRRYAKAQGGGRDGR